MKLIKNAKIITDSQVLEHNVILFDTKIHAILPEAQVNEADYEVIDANGAYLSPGFIDIHKHGAFNYDFMDADNQAAIAMLARLPETGVTSLYPTTMSMSFADIRKAMETIRDLMQLKYTGTQVLGCHMEGPFISPDWGGAQPREYIVPADYSLVAGLEDTIKLVTVAPEEPGNMAFIS